MELIKTLNSGVKKYSLSVKHDIEKAQSILNKNVFTKNVKANNAFEIRKKIGADFVGTYEVLIKPYEEYKHFIKLLVSDKAYNVMLSISFEEWETGKLNNGKRIETELVKLNYDRSLVRFYIKQDKQRKVMYFTISDRIQHLVGMSYYNNKDWTSTNDIGFNEYDTRNTRDKDCLTLSSVLHDDKLYIGMLHNNIDDTYNMDNRLLARTMFRLLTIDNTPCLVATGYHGNKDSKRMLHDSIELLKENDIYSTDVLQGDLSQHIESCNSVYQLTMIDDVHVMEEDTRLMYVPCPMCEGKGERIYKSKKMDKDVKSKCVLCDGTKEYKTKVYYHYDDFVEIKEKVIVNSYSENYIHKGDYIIINIDTGKIKENRKSLNEMAL
jgi:hypothetical protein